MIKFSAHGVLLLFVWSIARIEQVVIFGALAKSGCVFSDTNSSGPVSVYSMNEDYIKRINKVFSHIEEHLNSDLSLEKLSAIANYSPFHLHRLFKAIANETLNVYVVRKRVERGAMQLIHRGEMSISEIALQNGFSSNSSFTRAFNKVYGVSPTVFRISHLNDFSKIGKTESKIGKASYLTEEYVCNINNLKNWIKMNAKVEIKDMSTIPVAYVTQIGVNGLEQAFGRILKWAGPRGLLSLPDTKVVRIFHDSFKVTDEDKVRMSVGVTLTEKIKPEGQIAVTEIKGGKYFVGRFEIAVNDFGRSWDSLFIHMNENGLRKADGNPFEIYHNNPEEHPEKKCIVDLCIPVE